MWSSRVFQSVPEIVYVVGEAQARPAAFAASSASRGGAAYESATKDLLKTGVAELGVLSHLLDDAVRRDATKLSHR